MYFALIYSTEVALTPFLIPYMQSPGAKELKAKET